MKKYAKSISIILCLAMLLGTLLLTSCGGSDDNPSNDSVSQPNGTGRVDVETSTEDSQEEENATKPDQWGENETSESDTTSEVAPHDHVTGDWVVEKEATVKEDGNKYQPCTICGEKINQEIIFATGSAGLAYALDQGGYNATITGVGNCTDNEIYIGRYIDDHKVIAIADNAFSEQTGVTFVHIPDTVVSIGTRAFYGCTGLTEMTIPSSVEDIGTQVFYKADNLKTVYYHSRYANENNPFLQTSSIDSVVFGGFHIPADLVTPNIQNVTVLGSVKSVAKNAFEGCVNIANVYIEDLSKWCNIVFDEGKYTNPFYGYETSQKLYVGGELVTDLVIPDGVTNINPQAFNDCDAIRSVHIPSSVQNISNYAFAGCSSLTDITIDEGVISIGDRAFFSCPSLTKVSLPNSLKSIGEEAFLWCDAITSFTLPPSVTTIGKNALKGCPLTSLAMSFSSDSINLKQMGISTIEQPLEEIIINGGNSIPTRAFEDVVVKCVTLSDTITTIERSAFSGCSLLSSMLIPDSVSLIDEYAFLSCSSLTSIVIPDSVIQLGTGAFSGCNSLTDVYFTGTEEQWNSIVSKYYLGIPENTTFHFNYTP